MVITAMMNELRSPRLLLLPRKGPHGGVESRDLGFLLSGVGFVVV